MQASEELKLIVDGKRLDGRAVDEIRPTTIKAGVLNRAEGSAYVEMGNTKAIAGVFGPRPLHPRHLQKTERGVLRCKYTMAPFSVDDRKRPGPDRRSTEISMVTANAIYPVLDLSEFPKTGIDVIIEILQADASTRIAGLNAAVVALADAGIEMKDLVSSVSVGKIDGEIVLDVAGDEDCFGDTDMPVAMIPRTGEVTLLQLDGNLSMDEFEKAFSLARKGVKEIYSLQVNALKERYSHDRIIE